MELLLQLLITLVVLFVLARLGSAIVSRFGLPGLIGEIVMGIVIANIAFGDGWSLMEDLLAIEMPDPVAGTEGSTVYQVVYAFAELGVIFLLFTVGLETKVKDLMNSGRPALLCAILGVIIPFVLGFALIMAWPNTAIGGGDMNHALFLAAAMVATSVGITARIIKDLKLMDTKEARIIIAAAVIDDVLGMIVRSRPSCSCSWSSPPASGLSRGSTTTSMPVAGRPRPPAGCPCPSTSSPWRS